MSRIFCLGGGRDGLGPRCLGAEMVWGRSVLLPMFTVDVKQQHTNNQLTHSGLCKDYSYSSEIISCSMLTDNEECIRVYYGEGRTLGLRHCYPFSRM